VGLKSNHGLFRSNHQHWGSRMGPCRASERIILIDAATATMLARAPSIPAAERYNFLLHHVSTVFSNLLNSIGSCAFTRTATFFVRTYITFFFYRKYITFVEHVRVHYNEHRSASHVARDGWSNYLKTVPCMSDFLSWFESTRLDACACGTSSACTTLYSNACAMAECTRQKSSRQQLLCRNLYPDGKPVHICLIAGTFYQGIKRLGSSIGFFAVASVRFFFSRAPFSSQ
jgi:hypothetical protein